MNLWSAAQRPKLCNAQAREVIIVGSALKFHVAKDDRMTKKADQFARIVGPHNRLHVYIKFRNVNDLVLDLASAWVVMEDGKDG